MAAKTTTRRLDEAYAAFVDTNNREPNVSELRSTAGVRQEAAATYPRDRRISDRLDKIPPTDESLKDTFHTQIWPRMWELALNDAHAAVDEVVQQYKQDLAAAQEALATATQLRAEAEKSRDVVTASREEALTLHSQAVAARHVAESEDNALIAQLATSHQEAVTPRIRLDVVQERATTAQSLATDLYEALNTPNEK
ncbi:hypothetical protein [Brevibacterium luteolum]|uniref:hypothetical protein n=1 Tax=Brevibacterium luteolum TaxID=199591 RepID=UPI001C248A66|nr:hypothetical protein [Brevibacterium luteolum]MBU8579995.1 hypothetical protein [Brevibacterium luteolum]